MTRLRLTKGLRTARSANAVLGAASAGFGAYRRHDGGAGLN
jgi:hypothetical protein